MPEPNSRRLIESYRAMLAELAESTVRAQPLKLSDDMVVVILARILEVVVSGAGLRAPWPATLPLDPELLRDLEPQLPMLFSALPRRFEGGFLDALVRARLHVVTLADALDIDTIRMLGTLDEDVCAAGAFAHVDLIASLASSTANDVVDFSLELWPRVLETRRARGAGTHPVNGYGGVGRRGTVDSMVLTELAWQDEELARRILDGELLHFTREQAPDDAGRLHMVIIDASASMRGDREVFARGLAIALGKKLQLGGEDVWLRFFDSRLYEVHRSRARGRLPVAWLLGFRGERGRNPARVFAQLATELALLRAHDPRDRVVHLITHAALQVPRTLVAEVSRLAHLVGVFIAPSGGELDLDWLDLVESHAVIDHDVLIRRGARAKAAAAIVDRAERVAASTAPRASAAGARAATSAIRK
jgi:hypothetical protein